MGFWQFLQERKTMQKNEGVYLSEKQIQYLEQKIELPIVDTPVFLHANEVAVYYSKASRQETKNRVVGRTSSYGGGTVRIAKGLSVRTGSSTSQAIYGDVLTQYAGELVITNERVVFVSDQKAFELYHKNITAATVYKDGIFFQSKSNSYVLILPRSDLVAIAFDGIRMGNIPIAGVASVTRNLEMNNNSSQMSAAEHAEMASGKMAEMMTTFDPDVFFESYKELIYHQQQVTLFWRSRGGDPEIEDLMETLLAEKEDYVNIFLVRCHNEGLLSQLKERLLQHSADLTQANLQYIEELLDSDFDADMKDADDDVMNVKEACLRLKENLHVDMSLWNEMQIEFKCNLVTSYDQLQLNYEIKGIGIVPQNCGGVEININAYNAAGDILCVEDDYISLDKLSRKRYAHYILLHLDDVHEVDYIDVFANKEDN